ncbi:hypothetical protein [Cupriavidus basilensis]|uniref:Uncharacterized protein n=1 Tax=Cupriavidus basilensis TaxID=68895 RepID=A0A643FQS8_9BURK|nr:hypothetical protein [Cupriavidus basilensis]QOT80703.1 hypothetical protein F7R26_025110 [Cupriavidus basilensis]
MPSATPNHAINGRSSSESLIDRTADFPDGEMCGKRLCVSRYRPATGLLPPCTVVDRASSETRPEAVQSRHIAPSLRKQKCDQFKRKKRSLW